jgi:quercetin dioxygenase-like cupin family protein
MPILQRTITSLGMISLGMGIAGPLMPVWADDHGHDGAASGVRVETLARSSQDWTGGQLPRYPSGQPVVTVLRITIPAGVSLPNHHHPVINAGVLQQGRLEVITEQGETLLLSAGDALIELVNRVHRGKSLGPEPAVIVVVYAGAEGLPTTVLDPGPSPGL